MLSDGQVPGSCGRLLGTHTWQPHWQTRDGFWDSGCLCCYGCILVLTSQPFSYYPPDPTYTISEDITLWEMLSALGREQHVLTRPDVVRFVIDAN
jgi:hypothetical protein